MEFAALRLAKLHRDTLEAYYNPLEPKEVTYNDYNNDLHMYKKCLFCAEHSDVTHYIPPLKLFHKLIEDQNLEALASLTYTVTMACSRCSQLLNKSGAFTLADQTAFIKSHLNGSFKHFGAK